MKIGDTDVYLLKEGAELVFPTGEKIWAVPHDTDAYRETARRHGYGEDTLKLCQEHEVTHVALCHWLGLVGSPTFDRIRSGDTTPCLMNGLEEDAVLAVQRFARAVGVDLLQRMKELYDERPRVQGVV